MFSGTELKTEENVRPAGERAIGPTAGGRCLLVGLDAAAVRVLQAARVDPEERGKDAQLVAAEA